MKNAKWQCTKCDKVVANYIFFKLFIPRSVKFPVTQSQKLNKPNLENDQMTWIAPWMIFKWAENALHEAQGTHLQVNSCGSRGLCHTYWDSYYKTQTTKVKVKYKNSRTSVHCCWWCCVSMLLLKGSWQLLKNF